MPAAVGRFAPTIRKVVVERLEEVVPRRQAEVASELAQPIPATAIALLLGKDEVGWRDLQLWTKGTLEGTIAGDLKGPNTLGKSCSHSWWRTQARKREPKTTS